MSLSSLRSQSRELRDRVRNLNAINRKISNLANELKNKHSGDMEDINRQFNYTINQLFNDMENRYTSHHKIESIEALNNDKEKEIFFDPFMSETLEALSSEIKVNTRIIGQLESEIASVDAEISRIEEENRRARQQRMAFWKK